MTDEANFQLFGYSSSQNCHYWVTENTCHIHQETLLSEKIICLVWCSIFWVDWYIFLENKAGGAVTVNSTCYFETLRAYLKPNLQRFGVEIQILWFQQDGATAHTVRNAMWVLGTIFPDHVNSGRGNTEWPARSSYLHVCDLFIWGYIKSWVYVKQPRTIEDLKKNLRDELAAVSPIVLQWVMQNFQKQVQECVNNNGHYLKDIVFKN